MTQTSHSADALETVIRRLRSDLMLGANQRLTVVLSKDYDLLDEYDRVVAVLLATRDLLPDLLLDAAGTDGERTSRDDSQHAAATSDAVRDPAAPPSDPGGSRLSPRPHSTSDREMQVAQDDLRRIMAALGISDYARPYSAHEVVEREVLPAIERLRRDQP